MYNEIANGRICWEHFKMIAGSQDTVSIREQEEMVKLHGAIETFKKCGFQNRLTGDVCSLILLALKYVEFIQMLEVSKN